MSVNLASMLREGTRKSHRNVGFIKCCLNGVVAQNCYLKLLANFYFIYTAIEEEIRRLYQHRIVGKIYFPELERQQNIEKDFCFYYGPGWRRKIAPSHAGKLYLDRIKEVSVLEPELLVAHCYTRYMGDLSGGETLKKIIRQTMNLSGPDGTNFYDFEDLDDRKAFKDKYRQAMNNLPLDLLTAQKIVDEANLAFDMNTKMLQELEGNLIKAICLILFSGVGKSLAILTLDGLWTKKTAGSLISRRQE